MRTRLICRTLVTISIFVATIAVYGHAAESETPVSGDQSFVVGDWYQLTIQRDDTRLPDGQGILLKVTDDWVVLGTVISEGSRTGVPLLRDLPYVGNWFGRSWGETRKVYFWIPRSLARVEKHEGKESCAWLKKIFADDVPALDTQCQCNVSFIKNHESANACGDFSEIKGGDVVLTDKVSETTQTPNPKWGHLPVIGGAFTDEHVAVHTVEEKVPLKDVLFIAKFVEMTPAQLELLKPKVAELRK